MLYIDYITKEIIADIDQLEKIFNTYEYLTWIFVGGLWIFWMILKYFLITIPIRLVFTNFIQKSLITIKNILPPSK